MQNLSKVLLILAVSFLMRPADVLAQTLELVPKAQPMGIRKVDSPFDRLSRFASRYDQEPIAGHRVFATSADQRNRLLIATSNGVYLYQSADKLHRIVLPKDVTPYTNIQYQTGTWWIISQNKLLEK